MYDFIVKINKGFAQVNRVISSELEPIQFAGEDYIPVEGFWNSFKNKIEYVEGEALALVVISDLGDFPIAEDITIAAGFEHNEKEIADLVERIIFSGATITSYPEVEFSSLNSLISQLDDFSYESSNDVEVVDFSQSSGLQAFYRKKTRDYKRR